MQINCLRYFVAITSALILTGCSSRNPMDYLPDMPAYMAINAEHVRASAGGGRLLDIARQKHPEMANLLHQRLKRLYLAVDPTERMKGTGYGVALGDAGFANFAADQFKQEGAKQQQMSGRKVLTSGSVCMTTVGDSGVLFFTRPQDLDLMIRTSQKKSPAAAQSATFKIVDGLAANHGFVGAADWTAVLSSIGNQLQQISMMNPKGVDALKQVKAASLTFDWDEQPVANATLHLPSQEGREDLAALANTGLGLISRIRTPKGVDARALSALQNMKAQPSEDGVSIKVEIPKDQAETWLRMAEMR
jgi:hypothetical protein